MTHQNMTENSILVDPTNHGVFLAIRTNNDCSSDCQSLKHRLRYDTRMISIGIHGQ